MTKEEYLKLIQSIYNQDDDLDIPEEAWIPAESDFLENVKKKILHQSKGSIDATNIKRKDLDKVFEYKTINIGSFIVYITESSKSKTDNSYSFSIQLYEIISKTHTGRPCKLQTNLKFDSRFDNCKWKEKFKGNGYFRSSASNVSGEELKDIIRWLQVIYKAPSFS